MLDQLERLNAALSERYHLQHQLGQGGMATVYLAHDLKHDRLVALKVLRPELAAVIGPERFLAEIKVTANLQHPHILPLFDSGQADTFLFYVMPFVEGESLRGCLAREKQLPVDAALRIATEVGSALDYAHRHGVIHRDIKPENILLHDGQALVADFGIALAVSAAGSSRMTETGISLGTPQYMSPEQAMGERTLDARSDIYALGCVAYEMLLGEPPFTGPTAQAILTKVMIKKPDPILARRDRIPPYVEDAVLIALEKLPADRFGSAADFAAALNGGTVVRRLPSTQAAGAPLIRWTMRFGWILPAAAALLGIVGGISLMQATHPAEKRMVVRFTTHVPAGTHLPDVPGTSFALSPDGHVFVYVGQQERGTELYLKKMDELRASPIPGTTGATSPFFSPDGRWVAFLSPDGLRRVPLNGGPVETVVNSSVVSSFSSNGWGSWGPNGTIAFETETGLQMVPVEGGPAKQITKVPPRSGITHSWPFILPSGDAVLFSIIGWSQGLENAQVAAVTLRTGEVRTLVDGAFSARLLPTGHLLFARPNGTLEAVRFDAKHLKLLGKPVPVLDSVRVEPGGENDIAISGTGTLVYLPSSTINRRLMRVDRTGLATPLLDHTAFYEFPTLSPDGRRLAVRIFEPAGLNIWVYDLQRGSGVRLTSAGSAEEPAWSRDGRRVVVSLWQRPNTGFALYSIASDGSGTRDVLFSGRGIVEPAQWTLDGRQLLLTVAGDSIPPSIMLLTPGDSTPPQRMVPGPAVMPALSPDGRWLAYVSAQTGRDEVYLRRFAGTTRQWLVSTEGGNEPRWGPDGHELFYRRGRQVFRVGFRDAGSDAVLGKPTTIFEVPYVTMAGSRMWDIAPNGQWFVMVEGHEVYDEFVTVLNWFDEVKAKVREGR
jgi:serine/threonine protein kinase/Tol biopolymer transport system component